MNSPPSHEATTPNGRTRPGVLYISYDGAGEPLGRSQVVSYLVPLASAADITLISFEKPAEDRTETAAILGEAGIRWLPLSYHKRPPVLSTAWDIVRGARQAASVIRSGGIQIVHCRSYVPGMMALLSSRRRTWAFLFDIRGFWVDERVEGGIWPPDGWLYRLSKRCERWLFASANRIVTLTHASVGQIHGWRRGPEVAIDVIPTCADIDRYMRSKPRDSTRLVWCGSAGTFYRFDLAGKLAERAGLPLLVLTRQLDLARELLGGQSAELRSVPHEQVPQELSTGDIGLCLYGNGFSNLARAPTRFAEYLAAGMSVVVTPGVGDLPELVRQHRVGAVLEGEAPEQLDRVIACLNDLQGDPELPTRARSLARELFSLDAGVAAYRHIYRELAGSIDHRFHEVER